MKTKKNKVVKKRNRKAQDLTLINLDPVRCRLSALESEVRTLNLKLKALEK